jgi:glycosyltransferase involved in cell wall biosynthesis
MNRLNKNLWIFNPQTILESINWLPPGKIYTYFNRKNNKRLATQIQVACESLGFKDPLLIIDNDFYNGLYLGELLQSTCVMYYLRDYLLYQPYFNKHGVRAEPAILKKVDVVTTNSLYLAEYAEAFNPNTFYIGQGCEVEEFEKKPAKFPADMQDIPKPVIGYCGALLGIRLDIDLLENIARQQPAWSIVLVGPEDEDFKKSALHQLKNVYFLGHKMPATLPAYVHNFDVCLNPQVVNQMTIGNYPRKIDEYLAAGKPVVATATKAMEEFKDSTLLCNNLEEYIAAIQLALNEKDDEDKVKERIAIAKSHTWQHSVRKLYNAVNNTGK